MSQIVLTLALLALAWPLAAWMNLVYGRETTTADRVYGPIESALYAALGVDPDAPMGWRAWARALLTTNLALAITLYALFLAQGALPLNPDGVPGMSWDLALHTTASFITNTNQQHYSGQAQLSYLGQLVGIVTPMVVTPAIGLAVMVAALRGFGARDATLRRDARGDVDLGNYHRDVVRSVTPRAAAAGDGAGAGAHLAGRAEHAAGRAARRHAGSRGGGAGHPRRAGGADGRHQAARHERRRLVRARTARSPWRTPRRCRTRWSSRPSCSCRSRACCWRGAFWAAASVA